jgi:hypothetical protein
MNNKTLTSVNYAVLCDLIKSAEKRVIYAAPGIFENVAKSLCEFAKRHSSKSVRIILEANPDTCRLGFGSYPAIVSLTEAEIEILKAEGLRIGILIVDDAAWIYAPTPEIILEVPKDEIINAVAVSPEHAEQLILSIAPDLYSVESLPEEPDKTESATDLTEDILEAEVLMELPKPEIKTEKFTVHDAQIIEKSLKENPVQKFDYTRRVEVYKGFFQFVDLNLIGCRFTSQTITLPNSLLSLPADDEMRHRINSTCKLFDDTSELTKNARTLEKEFNDLRKIYVKSLGSRFGSVILRSKKNELTEKLDKIRAKLIIFVKEVENGLQKEIDTSIEKLLNMFKDGVMKNPPTELKGQIPADKPDEETACEFIKYELNRVMPNIEKFMKGMEIYCDYKDVTYEMLNDDVFVQAIKKNYPLLKFDKTYESSDTLAQRDLF